MNVSRMRRMAGGAIMCAGVLAATIGLGSGAAQAEVSPAATVPAGQLATTAAGFAEYRGDYGYHPGHAFFAPRPYYYEPFPWFAPRPYAFRGHYR
jgi:hypothetical protein